jgi:hypothetical protein
VHAFLAADRQFNAYEMRLYAACARRRLRRIIGGDEALR